MRELPAALTRGRSRWRRPRLSVVVPVYNVEPFLAECLDSLLAQSFGDFEALLVVDGSTDGSGEIAEQYAREDSRLRVLHQANAGLGAARNAGVRAARGEFLAFLDSDDKLPPDAYAVMMETLLRTGSDLVSGALERNGLPRQGAMRLMRENHRARRERVATRDAPLLLADVFAVNKVLRLDFWRRAGLEFPEGLLYEDQPTLTRALLSARQLDVIPETVYLWRVRDDQSSITQRRHEFADLRDRMESKRLSTGAVRAAGIPSLLDPWYRDILPVDMWEYFRAVPTCSDDYWELLRSAVREFWTPATVRFEDTRLPVQQRLMGWLVEHGKRSELTHLIEHLDLHRGSFHVEDRDGRQVAVLPGVDDPGVALPPSVYVLGEHEVRPAPASGLSPPPSPT